MRQKGLSCPFSSGRLGSNVQTPPPNLRPFQLQISPHPLSSPPVTASPTPHHEHAQGQSLPSELAACSWGPVGRALCAWSKGIKSERYWGRKSWRWGWRWGRGGGGCRECACLCVQAVNGERDGSEPPISPSLQLLLNPFLQTRFGPCSWAPAQHPPVCTRGQLGKQKGKKQTDFLVDLGK